MLKNPKKVEKKWGVELWLHNSPMYCGKILAVDEGKACSLHHHEQKHETFYMLSGRIFLELDGVMHVVEAGSVVEIPPYTQHRFTAVGGPAVIVEVSTQHFEHDSIREPKRVMGFQPLHQSGK